MSDKAMLIAYAGMFGGVVLYALGLFIWSRWPRHKADQWTPEQIDQMKRAQLDAIKFNTIRVKR